MPFIKVNPKQARRFTQASGKLAKTDRVDSEMLAKMGVALQLKPKPVQAENLYDLRESLSARRALIKDRTAAKTRRATSTVDLIKAQLDKRLRHIEADIDKIDAQMLELVRKDQHGKTDGALDQHSRDRHKYGAHDTDRFARDRQPDQ